MGGNEEVLKSSKIDKERKKKERETEKDSIAMTATQCRKGTSQPPLLVFPLR